MGRPEYVTAARPVPCAGPKGNAVESNPAATLSATVDGDAGSEALLAGARKLMDADLRHARSLAEQALRLAEQNLDTRAAIEALLLVGHCAQRMADFEAALPCLRRALQCAIDIDAKARVGDALQAIGNVYDDVGDYPQALDFHLQALAIYEVDGDLAARANTLRTSTNAVIIGQARYTAGSPVSLRRMHYGPTLATLLIFRMFRGQP